MYLGTTRLKSSTEERTQVGHFPYAALRQSELPSEENMSVVFYCRGVLPLGLGGRWLK